MLALVLSLLTTALPLQAATPTTLQWTHDGNPIGGPITAPPGANDAELTLANGTFTAAAWTRDQQVIARFLPPAGANDAHLTVGQP